MKHNYAKKWIVSEQSAIQKRYFFEKSPFLFFYKPIPLFKEHVLVGNALDWQKFNWHKSHLQNGDRQKSNW